MEPVSESERLRHAESAFRTIAASPSSHVLVSVRCAAGHHVATVYETPAGAVYRTTPRRHSHGDRDLPDPMKQPESWLDMLNEGPADAALPAWCDCGARQLDRATIQSWSRGHERKVVID